MTAKSEFTSEEWESVLEGPPAAALMIALAQRGGTFRESYSIAKAYTEARSEHGASQLLDDMVAEKPRLERPHVTSADELKRHALEKLGRSLSLVEQKASAGEAESISSSSSVWRRGSRRRTERGSSGSPAIASPMPSGRRSPR